MSNQAEQPFQPPTPPLPPQQPVAPYGQQPQQYPAVPQPPQGYPGAFPGQNQAPAQPMYYGNPGYPQQPMVYANSGPKGLSISGMVLGIASIIGFGVFILPQIAGIILSHLGWSKEQPQGKGFAIAGLILNYLSLLIYGLLSIFWVIALVAAASYSQSN